MTIGERIKAARKKAGLTQKELGDKLGVSYQMIGQYENDSRKPKLETLEKIANALQIDAWVLYDGYILIPKGKPTPAQQREREQEKKDLFFLNSMSSFCDILNDKGQEKAIEQVEMLTKIPEYRKEESPDQEDPETDPKE